MTMLRAGDRMTSNGWVDAKGRPVARRVFMPQPTPATPKYRKAKRHWWSRKG